MLNLSEFYSQKKNEALKLDDNLQVIVKLLGILHMINIRKNQQKIHERLNIQNHGDDGCDSIVGTISIPNGFNFVGGTEDFFEDKCWTLSIILGCCIIYGKYLKKEEFKTKGSFMNDINSKTLKKKKCACKALLTEYLSVIDDNPLLAVLPQSLNYICPILQEHYGVNITVHETRSDLDFIIAQFPQEYDHEIPCIDIHQKVNENEFVHVSLKNP